MTRQQKQTGICETGWRLKVDSLSREQMYADSEFQYDAAETEMHGKFGSEFETLAIMHQCTSITDRQMDTDIVA